MCKTGEWITKGNAFPTEAPIRASARALTHARVPLLVPPWRQLLRLLLRLLVLPGSRGLLLLRLRLLPALREDLLRDLLLLRHHPRLPPHVRSHPKRLIDMRKERANIVG